MRLVSIWTQYPLSGRLPKGGGVTHHILREAVRCPAEFSIIPLETITG